MCLEVICVANVWVLEGEGEDDITPEGVSQKRGDMNEDVVRVREVHNLNSPKKKKKD